MSSATVRSVCLVPSGLLNFEGKIMPNAHTFADDVDTPGGDRELIVGSISGKLAIFKGLSTSDSACTSSVDGCISSIVTLPTDTVSSPFEPPTSTARSLLILVMTAEGTCAVLRRVVDQGVMTLHKHTQFAIPLNVSAAEMLTRSLVVLGTRDSTLHFVDISQLDAVKEVHKLHVPGQVESFLRSSPLDASPRPEPSPADQDPDDEPSLLVCLHTGDVLHVTPTASTVLEQGDSLQCGRAYVLSGVQAKGASACDAFGYFNGHVKLKDAGTGELRWSIQLPDALLTMATINLFQDGDEEVMLCCWNGDVYIVNAAGSQLKFTIPFSISAFFSGSFATAADRGSDDVLFCATTSGGILYYVGMGQSIRHIRHDSVLDEIKHSTLYSSIDTPTKRRSVLAALRHRFPSALHALPTNPTDDDDDSTAPTLQQCIRACVYASNSIFSTPCAPPAAAETTAAGTSSDAVEDLLMPSTNDVEASGDRHNRDDNIAESPGGKGVGPDPTEHTTDDDSKLDDKGSVTDEQPVDNTAPLEVTSTEAPQRDVATPPASEQLTPLTTDAPSEARLSPSMQSEQRGSDRQGHLDMIQPALEQPVEDTTPTAPEDSPTAPLVQSTDVGVEDLPGPSSTILSTPASLAGAESDTCDHSQASNTAASPTNQRRRGRGKGSSRRKKSDG